MRKQTTNKSEQKRVQTNQKQSETPNCKNNTPPASPGHNDDVESLPSPEIEEQSDTLCVVESEDESTETKVLIIN